MEVGMNVVYMLINWGFFLKYKVEIVCKLLVS